MKTPTLINPASVVSRLLIALVVAVGLVSCESDVPTPGGSVDGTMQAVFTVVVSAEKERQSRAPGSDDEYDRGQGYENYIDIPGNNFRFYLFDSTDRFLAELATEAVLPMESGPGSKKYVVDCDAPAIAKDKNVKLVVLANWPSYPSGLTAGVSTIEDLWNVAYDFTAASMKLSETTLIPLFGIGREQRLALKDGEHTDLGSVHLLRAYAKVEVIRSATSPVDITSVVLRRYNNKGYCAANVRTLDDYLHNSYEGDYTQTPHFPSGCEVALDLPLIPSADKRSWLAYVPEYRNIGRADNEKCSLIVKFDGSDDENTVHFCTYAEGDAVPGGTFDVLRNVWYIFAVSKNMPPMVQVVPYGEVELDPVFGLLIGRDLVPIYEDDGSIRYYYDDINGIIYDKNMNVVDNPYLIVDPATGWTIIRDIQDDSIIGYFDPKTGTYYAPDKETIITDPRQS